MMFNWLFIGFFVSIYVFMAISPLCLESIREFEILDLQKEQKQNFSFAREKMINQLIFSKKEKMFKNFT